jgi:hypothetical protein
MTFRGAASSAVLLLGLAACDPAPSREENAKQEAAPATAANNAAAPAPAAAAGQAGAPIVLEGTGLRIAGASPPRTIAFEAPEAATIEALTAALGGPPAERGENEECGEGALQFAAWRDRLTVWFQEGRFAGWDAGGDLRTAGGVGVGSSRAEAAALPGFEVEQSSLGVEFRAEGLSGILASNAPDARVTDLWAGSTCVFR